MRRLLSLSMLLIAFSTYSEAQPSLSQPQATEWSQESSSLSFGDAVDSITATTLGFATIHGTGGQSGATGTTPEPIVFTGAGVFSDSTTYTFNPPSADLIINVPGTYLITYDVGAQNTSNVNVTVQTTLDVNGIQASGFNSRVILVPGEASNLSRTSIITVSTAPSTVNVLSALQQNGSYKIETAGGVTIQRLL